MSVTAEQNQKNSQSQSILKLRRKMQNQMKKQNVSYEDILKKTQEAKRGEQ